MSYTNRTTYNRRKSINWVPWAFGVSIVLVIAGLVGGCNAYFGTTRDVTFTVRKTDACGHRDKNGCTMLVYTDHGVYKDSDSLISGKFNSSDVLGSLCPGGVYKVHVRGYRNGFLNMWPNILKVEQVVTPPPATTGCTN